MPRAVNLLLRAVELRSAPPGLIGVWGRSRLSNAGLANDGCGSVEYPALSQNAAGWRLHVIPSATGEDDDQ